ncbi:PDZ domain-containing protein [Flavobacterium sp.]|uniref:retropepsin-like aspartic protease n=1 Tax=Flavobacterium sp. TaxID=239 RepID=UPI00286B641F|nr:PDZ domain-containing protein [Flavobacterium sp.]
MTIRYLILFFTMCPMAVLAQSGFQFESNKDKVVIPFQLINNLIFIPIEVNGVELNFLLDSGVEETILLSLEDKTEVRFNNVKKIKLRGLGDNEAIEGLKSSNNTLSFKGLIDRHHDVYIVLDQDFNFSSHIGIPVNGIIGYHFFENNLVEINYNRKKIIVYKDNDRLEKRIKKQFTAFPITIEKNKPYINADVTLNDKEINAKLLIDLGNSDPIWLFENAERNISIPETKFEDYLGRGFSGDINGYRSKISKFKLQNFEFADPIVSFPGIASIKSVNMVPNRVGSVGGEILKRFNIIFDYSHEKMLLKKSRYYSDNFTYNMSGIELQNEGMQWVQETVTLNTVDNGISFDNTGEKTDNNFKYKFTLKPIYTIVSVRKNSPAEACGLQAGDLIISINSMEAYRYSLQALNDLLKSDEGRWLNFTIERGGKTLKFKFQLKSIL